MIKSVYFSLTDVLKASVYDVLLQENLCFFQYNGK